MSSIIIERIDKANAGKVFSLFNQYRIFYKQPSDMQLAEIFIQARLDNDESVIFAAFINDNGKLPVGFTQLYPAYSSVSGVKKWILNDLYVEAEQRKKGIGEKLIKAVLQFAKETNAVVVQLETATDNFTAQKLYEAIGFKKHDPHQGSIVYQIKID